MKHNLIFIFILFITRIIFSQQILFDSYYHFSFIMPSGWTHTDADSSNSFIRFECYNPDSTTMVEYYAIKAKNNIDLNKFSTIITSEEVLGKSLGNLKDSSQVLINGIKTIKKNYEQKLRRRGKIIIQAFILVKENYGYTIVTRTLRNVNQTEELNQMIESFTISLPRSTLSWLALIGLIGVCIYGFILGILRILKWFGPLNWRSIIYCAILTLICLATLFVIFVTLNKINLIISLVTGGLLIFGISKIPDPNPVIDKYKQTKQKNSAGAYRVFCQQYKSSKRYYQDARKRMSLLMDEVIKKYEDLVSKLDTPIVRASQAMFQYIKQTDNFQVGVQYNVHNQIKDFSELVKQQRNWTVLPAHPAFTDSKNREREQSITKIINSAFSQIFPEDILSFSTVKEPKSNQIYFKISYAIGVSGNLYYHTSEKDLPDDKKTYYTGVEFKWLLEIGIPGKSEKYQLTLESKPAQQFSTDGQTTDKVYDAMATSAFRDFSRVIIEQSGLMPLINKQT